MTRNYLTHFDNNIDLDIAKGEDILILVEKLKIILMTKRAINRIIN